MENIILVKTLKSRKTNVFYVIVSQIGLSNTYGTIIAITRKKKMFHVRMHSSVTVLSNLKIACFMKM